MKFDLHTLEDINLLGESLELECKLAQGQDGTGEVPKDFWRTYSAMANAQGGLVLLGVQEKSGQFSVAGLKNPAKVRADLFNTLNNRAKVSTNLLNDADVTTAVVDSRNVLVISIPAATRKQKPVFLNGQPLGNTWLRLNDGDRHCDDETVKRMLAEQVEDERDARILTGFGMHDLDGESLPTPDLVFMGPTFPSIDTGMSGRSSEHAELTSEHSELTSEHLAATSEHLAANSEHSDATSEDMPGTGDRDMQGRMLSAHLDAPIVDDLTQLEPTFLSALKDLAQEPAQRSRLERSRMETVILSICRDQFLTLSALSQLVCRSPDGLRQQYLSRMVKTGSMTLAFPTKPTHEKQAYRAAPGALPLEVTDSPSETQ